MIDPTVPLVTTWLPQLCDVPMAKLLDLPPDGLSPAEDAMLARVERPTSQLAGSSGS